MKLIYKVLSEMSQYIVYGLLSNVVDTVMSPLRLNCVLNFGARTLMSLSGQTC